MSGTEGRVMSAAAAVWLLLLLLCCGQLPSK